MTPRNDGVRMEEPDTPFADRFAASPNNDDRRAAIDLLILHYTGMANGADAQQRLCDADAKVSSHYLVHEDGATVQLVREQRRAWHAGASSWQGSSDINSRSIGIEIVNGGHDFGCPDFPTAQIEALIRLCRDILSRHSIAPQGVLAHSDVAPSRKRDPGEKFPWRQLHQAGVGAWVEPAAIELGETLAIGARGEAVAQLQRSLAEYGYDLAVSGAFDAATQDVVTAFQRHFRPARVDGMADVSTMATLRRLLESPVVG